MKKLIYTLPLLLALAACSDKDEPGIENNTGGLESNKYYFALNLSMPEVATSRATTDENGNTADNNQTVAATDNENALNAADIYLVDKDNTVVASFSTTGSQTYYTEIQHETDKAQHTVFVEVNVDNLMSYIKSNTDGLSIIVVGNNGTGNSGINQTVTGSDASTAIFPNTLGSAPIGAFGTDGEGKVMPLVSTEAVAMTALNGVTTSGKTDNEILAAIRALFTPTSNYRGTTLTGEVNTMPLTIKLERAVARVDYKDRTADERKVTLLGVANTQLNDFQYKIGDSDILIELDRINVYNQLSGTYLFRHTAAGDNSAATGAAYLFGDENGGNSAYNWVVTPNWTYGSSAYTLGTTYSYLNPLKTGEAYTPTLASTADVSVANMKLCAAQYTSDGGYTPCIYIPENTVHSKALMTTENLEKYATGVAFTFRVCTKTSGTDRFLTSSDLESTLPAGISKSTTTTGQNAITLTMPTGEWMDVVPTSGGYYELTYYGFLNHNNGTTTHNGAGITAENYTTLNPMHFAIVRNNAYQVSLANINHLPDEKDPKKLYLELKIEVKPWVKRRNEFTF